ncbi:MAG TPA: hypothetical protein VJ951_16345 [Bacteroidales bacterium]|nr:hypothetical protein [Bacteroidales bacterium]
MALRDGNIANRIHAAEYDGPRGTWSEAKQFPFISQPLIVDAV